MLSGKRGESRQGGGVTKRQEEVFRVMDMYSVLIAVVVSAVYTNAKTDQRVHLSMCTVYCVSISHNKTFSVSMGLGQDGWDVPS